jgi:Rhodopirellula transposase DDE domain
VEQDRAPAVCHITQNCRGRPLTDRLAVVELIGATTTKTGLKVESALDTRTISGFTLSDEIDLRGLAYTSGTTNLSWTRLTSGANACGTLTVSSGAAVESLPSRPREFHPEPLTDSGREPLDSSGSCHRMKAAAFHCLSGSSRCQLA